MRNYRNAFLFALAGNVAFLGILAAFWWRSMHHRQTEGTMQSTTTVAPSSPSGGPETPEMAPHEAALVPVQISPERLQSIGVRMGRVERKNVSDEIRVNGNVAVDETRLAYVQVRYPGYIQKVFADAT